MKISVLVKTKSKIESVEELTEEKGSFIVRVGVPPVDGKANEKVRDLLAEYFHCAKSSVKLVLGAKSKKKVFEINL